MTSLTTTQQTILEAAITRPDGGIQPLPEKIKGGAAIQVITALEERGLIEDTSLNPPFRNWCISDKGRRAIGQEPPELPEACASELEEKTGPQPNPEQENFGEPQDIEPEKATGNSRPDSLDILLDDIAQRYLSIDTLDPNRAVYEAQMHDIGPIKNALTAAYQAGLAAAGKTPRKAAARENSKQNLMIEMMKRPEGATIEQIVQATLWSPNTVRGAISGTLRKRLGLNITTQRLHYVGPNAKGGYTTYRIAE
ncbi:MAG: DUF3489 domain-containing protein [Magnetococcales bacterium]|nr:DUF3489 domain-containing protein [Magnetococcales bacterium]